MTNPIEKILIELYIKGNHEGFDKRNWGKLAKKCRENVSQALTLIRQHYEKKMLEKCKECKKNV